MSGEFREVHGSFMWSALYDVEYGEMGRHPISQALGRLYSALAPVEKGCAWYEACDSGASAPVVALLKAWEGIENCVEALNLLRTEYEEVIHAALREEELQREDGL